MKIVVLEGSPNQNGSTHILADSFRQGAQAADHTVESINVAHVTSTPAPAASAAGTKAPASRRTTWRASGEKSWKRT